MKMETNLNAHETGIFVTFNNSRKSNKDLSLLKLECKEEEEEDE